MQSKFKNNNNNNNNYNKNNKGDKTETKYDDKRFFSSRSYGFYYQKMSDPVEWQVYRDTTLRMVRNNNQLAEMEIMTMANEARFNHRREQAKRLIRKGCFDLEMKKDFNEKWFTQPVILYTDLAKIDIENYKMAGYEIRQTDSLYAVNFHDLLALERRSGPHLAIQKIVGFNPITKTLRRKIGDIGCSARGAALYAPEDIKFNRPIIEARDHMRYMNLIDKLSERYSQNEIDNMVCQCIQGKVLCEHLEECDVLNFTHSLYYMDLELINYCIKKGKYIIATIHIFAPGDYDWDFYTGKDHVANVIKKGNNIKMKIMNDKIYEHQNIMNYLWDRNEMNFKNCSVNVLSRVFHGNMHHITFYITPFKNTNPDYDMNFTFIINSAVPDPKLKYEEGLKNILSKENEIDFTQHYNDGKIGFLNIYDIDGKLKKNEDGSTKTTLIRKIKNDFILPKIINTNWLTFKSIQQKNYDANEYIYVKEELINSCLRSFSNDDMNKNMENIIGKITGKINTSNTDIIIAIAYYVIKAQNRLRHQIAMLKETEEYKQLKDKEYENYKSPSLFRPIDYIKDKVFNKQITYISKFNESVLRNKRFNNIMKHRMFKKLNNFFKNNKNNLFKYKQEQYKKVPKVQKAEDLKKRIVLNQAFEDKQQYVKEVQKENSIVFSDYHPPEQVNLRMYNPEQIQKLKNMLTKNLFCDTTILKNYLSEWGIADHPIVAKDKQDYKINYNVEYNYLFSKDEVKEIQNNRFNFNNHKYIHNDFDGDRSDCIFYALATAVARPKEDIKKLGFQIKKEALKASLNDGKWKDFLHKDGKGLDYLKSLCEYYGIYIVVFNQSDYENKKIKKLDITDASYSLIKSIDSEFIEDDEHNTYVVLLNNNGHLNVIRRKIEVSKQLYGSLKNEREFLKNERVLEKCCIDEKLYKEFIVNLANQDKDKFVCPMYPNLNASTSYEKFCEKIPCYCEGDMCLAHTLKDFDNDEETIFYGQCPRIQIIGSLRQLTTQCQYSKKLEKELQQFMERFFDERNIDQLIEKHFENIDYSRWLQRCKPNYRKAIIKFLEKKDNWYNISEPNIVNGVIKEEYQHKLEKSRMIGSPTILHKILMGPIESNFEELFKELFPDFWGVGESTNTKEYELNELINKYHCDKSVTLDISGLDQSHNKCVKMFWMAVCKKVRDFLKHKENSLFNPDHIYEMLTKNSTIIICRDKKTKKFTCITELVNKMASGQGYTTVLNTSLMCFLMEFTRYKFNLTLAGKISGDDVALVTNDTKDKMSTSLGYVFSKKDINVEGGCGLILKYFRYGELEAISPCSLMAFMCPNHGLRLVRQPQRYLSNFFYSQKMLLLPRRLRKTFFDTACLGEQYWSKGYDYFDEMNKVDDVDMGKLKEVLAILCGGSLKSNKVKKSDRVQERAYDLFMKKGYRLDRQFWDRSYYFIQKELNYIKIESKHEQHKIPVYPCCNEALNDHLNSIEPVIKYRLPCDVSYISKTLDQYYEDLNQKIKFTNKPSEKYYVKNYNELQQEAKYGNTYYRNVYMYLPSFYEAFNPYSKWMRYFQEKIKKWLKFL